MKKLIPSLFALLLLLLSGCAMELPVVTPAPVVLATPAPEAMSTAAVSPPAPLAAATAPSDAPAPTALPAAVASPAPTAALPAHPTVTETLAAGLDYLRSGFRLKMPPADAFTPVQPPADLEGVVIEQALAADGWQAVISAMQLRDSGRGYRTIIFSKDMGKKTMRWWGEVDELGMASTVVFTGMPRPKSTRVKGLTGRVVQLPEGSAYARYFEDAQGRRYGIATNKEAIQPLLENLEEADGRVQFWGELRYAVNDVNGRRILVRKYNLLDATPEEVLARATPQASGPSGMSDSAGQEAGVGPLAILVQPKPHAVIHTQAQVSGQVQGLDGDRVLLRVEHEDGRVLGEATAVLSPSPSGEATFTATLPFANPPTLSQGRIAAYAPDGDDSSLLGWVEVRFAGDVGERRVTILQPEANAAIRGQALAAGLAEAVPEQALLVRVEDSAGVVLGKARAKINANGQWRAQVSFRRPKTARPGVVAVYVVNPEGGLILLAQAPVKLQR